MAARLHPKADTTAFDGAVGRGRSALTLEVEADAEVGVSEGVGELEVTSMVVVVVDDSKGAYEPAARIIN